MDWRGAGVLFDLYDSQYENFFQIELADTFAISLYRALGVGKHVSRASGVTLCLLYGLALGFRGEQKGYRKTKARLL